MMIANKTVRNWRELLFYSLIGRPDLSKLVEDSELSRFADIAIAVAQSHTCETIEELHDKIVKALKLTLANLSLYSYEKAIPDDEIIRRFTTTDNPNDEANYECESDIVPQAQEDCVPEPEATKPKKQPKPAEKPVAEKQPKPATEAPKPTDATQNVIARLMDFMKENYVFRYNVLTRQSEVKKVGEDDTHYIIVTKHVMNSIIIEANMKGMGCWDRDVKRIIESTFTKEYHPMKEYFSKVPKWDGKDRLTELAKRVSSKESWIENFSIWMRGSVAQWMGYCPPGTRANCVALILISTEQGKGKSTFCRSLLAPELRRYYTERMKLSSEEACEKKLARFGIINLDEFDQISERHMALLKSIMQEQDLNVQYAYESTDTQVYRIASFVGTSNHRDLLTDRTGSRRFICVEPDRIIDCETPIEYDQLYAQIIEEIRAGKPIYFDKEHERQIERDNRPYYRQLPEEEAFISHFSVVDRTVEGAKFMTAMQIYNYLKKREPAVMRGTTAARFSKLIPAMGERVHHTKLGNGYYVVER